MSYDILILDMEELNAYISINLNKPMEKRMTYFKECVKDLENKIPKNWEHTSYGNDACPSYSFKNKKLFIDHPNPKMREGEDWKRFSITNDDEYSDNYQVNVLETDDFDTVVKFMGEK